MSTEILNLMQRRQAIERGLQQYFNGTMMERVLMHWEQSYSEKPAFVLNRFLSDICTTEELRNYRKEMLKQVLFELSALEKQELLSGSQKIAESTDERGLVSIQMMDAFRQFIAHVLNVVPTKDLIDFADEVKSQLARSGLAIEKNVAIESEVFVSILPVARYASIMTVIYEIFCEFYGPMRADQVFAQTKNTIKMQFPEVDLHQFL